MLGRLAEATDAASQAWFTAAEVQLHLEAFHQIKLALENLHFCLLNNERTSWEHRRANGATLHCQAF